jgi:hypothetical protein
VVGLLREYKAHGGDCCEEGRLCGVYMGSMLVKSVEGGWVHGASMWSLLLISGMCGRYVVVLTNRKPFPLSVWRRCVCAGVCVGGGLT